MLDYYRVVLFDPTAVDASLRSGPLYEASCAFTERDRIASGTRFEPFASVVPAVFDSTRPNLYADPRNAQRRSQCGSDIK